VNSRRAQRERFRHALRQARVDAGLSQRAVARVVGRTPSAVWQWEEGRGAPDAATVARLEQLLRLEPDALARLLGYAAPTGKASSSVVDAVRADPRLDESGRELLTTVYRWLVRRGSVGEGTS
jgi:transcriptional regulator with XRE-family HTH domain